MKQKVLFVCTHNSARSQIAEAILKDQYPEHFEAYSGGTDPTWVDPNVMHVLAEHSIDGSKLWAKNLNEFMNEEFDIVVTLCDSAKEACPIFPGAKRIIHHSCPDPAGFDGTNQEKLAKIRKVWDQISSWIKHELLQELD